MSRKKKKGLNKTLIIGFIVILSLFVVMISSGTLKIVIDASSINNPAPSNYKEIESSSDIDLSKNNIVFFSSSWCQSCDRVGSILKTEAGKYPNINFYQANIEENRDLANKYQINLTPAILLLSKTSTQLQQEVVYTDVSKIVSKFALENRN